MQQQLSKIQTPSLQNFPHHPLNVYNWHVGSRVDLMVKQYHNSQWILLQDQICFNQSEEYLKRYYSHTEHENKIKSLSDYYRYHQQMPRIFIQGIQRLFENHVQEKRAIQYQIVTKQMKVQKDCELNKFARRKNKSDCKKIIQDVQLSYQDFEEKGSRKEKTSKNNRKDECESQNMNYKSINSKIEQQKNQKGMTRVQSISSKGTFLVLKPRNGIPLAKKESQKKLKVESKQKKPVSQRPVSQQTQKVDPKPQMTLLKPEQVQKPQKSSKNSNNNSVSSQQTLSRSKSKAQLSTVHNINPLAKKQQKSSTKNLKIISNAPKMINNEKVLEKDYKNLSKDKKNQYKNYGLTSRNERNPLKNTNLTERKVKNMEKSQNESQNLQKNIKSQQKRQILSINKNSINTQQKQNSKKNIKIEQYFSNKVQTNVFQNVHIFGDFNQNFGEILKNGEKSKENGQKTMNFGQKSKENGQKLKENVENVQNVGKYKEIQKIAEKSIEKSNKIPQKQKSQKDPFGRKDSLGQGPQKMFSRVIEIKRKVQN